MFKHTTIRIHSAMTTAPPHVMIRWERSAMVSLVTIWVIAVTSNIESGLADPIAGCIDHDGDGYGLGCQLGSDCDDLNPDIHPGAVDICGDGIDQDCNGNIDNVLNDADGVSYCFQADPITAIVGEASSVVARGRHLGGIDRIELVRNGDFANKISQSCSGQQTCVFSTNITQNYLGPTYLSLILWKVSSPFPLYVTELNLPVNFLCQEEYCPPDPDLSIFFSWMRAQGYAECVTSQYITSSLDPLATPVIKESLAARTSLLTSPFTVHFYDIIPTDALATYRSLGSGEGGNCVYQSAWPSLCPTPVPADYDFVRRHFERTFGVAFTFVYHRMPVSYASTFGAPQLVNGNPSYYRFPNSRNTFVSQFPAQAIIHYAIESYNGLPVQDMTGAVGTRAEVSLEPYDILGISIYTHEWGHTWGLAHPFYGSPRVFTGLDGIMDNSYRGITPLVDPLDPVERYVLQPGSGYLDQLTFASTYSKGLLGSWQLPICGDVDPSILSADLVRRDKTSLTIDLRLRNNGGLPTGYVRLSAFDYPGRNTLIGERIIWQMPAAVTMQHRITLDTASVAGDKIEFVLDVDDEIPSEPASNNTLVFDISPNIPTLSALGLVTMLLLLPVAAAIVLRRRPQTR